MKKPGSCDPGFFLLRLFPFLFELERTGIEVVIRPLLFQQLFVRAAFDYAAVVEHHDDVGVADGGQAVRDDEHRSAFHQLIHAALHERLGARVYGAGSLVEDEHGRVLARGAGDGYELALTL